MAEERFVTINSTKELLMDADALRFRYLISDPETGRHLLSLLKQGKGDTDALRRMIDRILASKAEADAVSKAGDI